MTEEDSTEIVAFKWFAKAYPHEAYREYPQQFVAFCMEENPELTEEKIVELLNETDEKNSSI